MRPLLLTFIFLLPLISHAFRPVKYSITELLWIPPFQPTTHGIDEKRSEEIYTALEKDLPDELEKLIPFDELLQFHWERNIPFIRGNNSQTFSWLGGLIYHGKINIIKKILSRPELKPLLAQDRFQREELVSMALHSKNKEMIQLVIENFPKTILISNVWYSTPFNHALSEGMEDVFLNLWNHCLLFYDPLECRRWLSFLDRRDESAFQIATRTKAQKALQIISGGNGVLACIPLPSAAVPQVSAILQTVQEINAENEWVRVQPSS